VEAATSRDETKAEPKPAVKAPEKPAEAEAWTLQLIATAEAAEAKRVADKAKDKGFATTTVKEKGQLKVRLTKTADRAATDKTAEKLKKAGFKPFAVKVE
jgi:cell division septation protein DedD